MTALMAQCATRSSVRFQAPTLRYDKVLFIVEPSELATSLARKRVTVCDYPDGRLEIRHNTVILPYRTFDKLRSVNRAEVVENKRLGAALKFIADKQSERTLARSGNAPSRRGQKDHIFETP